MASSDESSYGAGAFNPNLFRKADVRLPGKGNSNFHGARPVHFIVTKIYWIRTSRLSIKKTLSLASSDESE